MRHRRRKGDALGLRGAGGTRALPGLVGAMAFVAALAAAGLGAAHTLAGRWEGEARAMLTAQVPGAEAPGEEALGAGGQTRLQKATMLLKADARVAEARPLSAEEMSALLKPWVGDPPLPADLPLPGVIGIRLAPWVAAAGAARDLAARLSAAVPGATVDAAADWSGPLVQLAMRLQVCAGLVLAVVGSAAAIGVAAATQAGLVARREAVLVAHGLGATDGYIASQFARRALCLCAGGAALGAMASVPLLVALAGIGAPLGVGTAFSRWPSLWWPGSWWGLWWSGRPLALWLGLCALPAVAAAIGFVTAQATVRGWLRRLP